MGNPGSMNRGQHATQRGHSGNRVAAVGKIENEPADPQVGGVVKVFKFS